MKFNIFINDKTIHEAAEIVHNHYKSARFLDSVYFSKPFNLCRSTPPMVAAEILKADIIMDIVPYKTKWPWSKVIGYASGDTIYVNTRKLDLPLADRVENFMHEGLHLLGYSHKGNTNNEFNRGTVPYAVSALLVKYLKSIGKL